MEKQRERHRHIFPIVDAMVEEALNDLSDDGQEVSCHKGCDHCCHLLVEVAWEEAVELALWIENQPTAAREKFLHRVRLAADNGRKFFLKKRSTAKYAKPVVDDKEIPDSAFDQYFYDEKRPCPFLVDGSCAAYEARPTPCRLHMVTSPSDLCASDVEDDDDYEVPERLETLKEEFGPVARAMQPDPRWGHLAIMVETAWDELQISRQVSAGSLAKVG